MSKKLLFVTFIFILGIFNVFAETTENIHSREYNYNFSALSGKISGEAVISTDKNNYQLNDAVVIRGVGFQKFEQVYLSVEQFDKHLSQNIVNGKWVVFADENGTFSTDWRSPSFESQNNQFTVKAEAKSASPETYFTVLLNPSANLDQCANGPFSAPSPCTGANWQNGNLGQSQAHYYEGDSVPYRLKFNDLATGAGNPHSVTIEWDTTQSGKHAIDYLTTYNRTEVIGNNPCSGVVPACGPATTFPIPSDPNVSGAGVTQVGGQFFTMWGGTITSVSSYSLSGLYAGNSSTRITINFTANQANPVLAWGGHIADRLDWAALGGSASDINGSPYHMRLFDFDGGGGNQDRSLSNVAVRLDSRITIIQVAQPESTFAFPFTSSAMFSSSDNVLPTSFSLEDDGDNGDGFPDNITGNNLLAPATSQTFNITQGNSSFYALVSIVCSVNPGGTSTTTTSLPGKLASISLNYGDSVTCVFSNSLTTAANVAVSGRTLDASGAPIANTRVRIQNTTTLETRTAYTNSFGYYRFDELAAGDLYVITVANKRYNFAQNTRSLFLNEAVEDVNFTAQE